MFRKAALALLAGLSLNSVHPRAAAADVDAYIGDIMMVGFNFCPRNWAELNGQLIPISQNNALFSLIGTTYGGDGITTFALPDMRGRTATQHGQGAGLTPRQMGQAFGRQAEVLTPSNLPLHNHAVSNTASSTLHATDAIVNSRSPSGAKLGEQPIVSAYASGQTLDSTLASGTVQTQVTTTLASAGSNLSFEINQPSTGILYCIALFGTYPPRN